MSYPKVIDILTSDANVDYKAMCIVLAKECPEMFLDFYAKVNGQEPVIPANTCRLIVDDINRGQLISAIKTLRGVFHIVAGGKVVSSTLSLKSARDIIYVVAGREHESDVYLDNKDKAIVKELKKFM